MRPRHLTGLPGNFFAGACLTKYLAARTFSFIAGALLATASFAASNVIQYTYDPAGNITNITRQSTGGLAITSFNPTSGSIGTAVTIYGTGFSATPANNAVTFNGTAATVTASDSGSIATTVPTSATTGRISVTVGGGTVQSAIDFVVTIAGAPTIASFTPAIGAAGTSVSVTGTNFNATSGATTFTLNGVAATGGASSTTAASLTIPSNASSGRISATTSVGTGTSASDFIVPPTGLSAGDIETTRRISAGGGNVQVTVGTPNRSALVLFDGAVNGWYSIQFKALDLSPSSVSATYKIIKPDNTVLVSGTIGMGSVLSLHLPKLPVTGTYTLQLSPGIATLNTFVRLDANPALIPDGADAAIAQDFSQQTSRFVFDATAGQRVGFGLKDLTRAPGAGNFAAVHFYQPDGSSAGQVLCDTTLANCGYTIVTAATGTYQVIQDTAIVGGRVQLSTSVTGTLAPDVTQAVSLTRVGQRAAYTFTIASGDSFGLDLSNVALAPQSGALTLYVLNPDGTQLSSCSATQPAGAYCELGANKPAGTYTAYVEPDNGSYGTFNLTLKKGTLLATTEAPSSFAPAGTSEAARVRFTATAGQTISVGVGGLTYVGSGGGSTLYVYGSDGSSIRTVGCIPWFSGGDCKVTLTNLAAGTYAAVLRPAAGVKTSGTFTVSTDIAGGALTLGTTQPVTVSRIGQRATFTFAGTSGDNIGVSVFGISTTPADESVTVRIMKPDGSELTSSHDSRPFNILAVSLPTTGTYTAILESDAGPTFSAQFVVDPGIALTIDGSTTSLSADVAGRPLRARFAGTVGQRVELGLFGLGYASGSSGTSLRVYAPDTFNLGSATCSPTTTGSCEYSNASLGMTGTYLVLMVPPATSQITAGTLAVSTPLTGSFVIGDPAQSISISRPGQTARYTFSGTAAQTLRLNWTSVSVAGTDSVSATILNPGGGTVSSSTFANGATGGFDIAALPSTGTYTVALDPPSGTTMSGSFSLVTR